MNNKVPEIRFEGFVEEWEKVRLKKLATFEKGSGYSKGDLISEGVPIILYGRLYTQYQTIINDVDTFVELKEKTVFSKGNEVIIPASGETSKDIARASVVGQSGVVLGGDLNIVIPKESIDSIFLALAISNGEQQKELSKKAQGKSVVHIYNSEIKKINLVYPNKEEQTRIGRFFKLIEDKISLHQHELENLKKSKKAFLQKMFPKDGETIPEIRFPGFIDEWEEKVVKDIFTVTRGKVLATAKTKPFIYDNYIYPVYSSQTMRNGLMGYYDEYLFEDAITWTTDGANAGTVKFRSGKFYSTNVNGVLLSEIGYANKALAEVINKVAWKFVSKVGNPKLMNNIMSEIVIKVPNLEEQKKLSAFLNQIDNTIALQQSKLDQLEKLKKAFLQKMFV